MSRPRELNPQPIVGTTTTAYDDWKTTITDPTSKVKDIYKDAYNNLIQVGEHKGSTIYTTTYEYNGLSKLTKLTDAEGNIRNFTYNGIGNVLTAQDLHTPSDTTFGTWTFSYDASSNLSSRTNPNSQVVNFTYDDINRVLTENYTGATGTEVIYVYDSCSEGIGHLCEVTNPASTVAYTYNKIGQQIEEEMNIDSEDFTTVYTYDRQGNQLVITNPDNSQAKYLYDAAGAVNKIQHKESSAQSFSDVISSLTYNPVGLIETANYGNGSTTTNTYDADELYRLRHKVTSAGTDSVQDLTYTYDPVGNIAKIIDASDTDTAKTTDYTYDGLDRLTESAIKEAGATALDGPNAENSTQEFTYDPNGNINSNPDNGGYKYFGHSGTSYANPHAVTQTDGGHTFTYDHNGNVTSDEFDGATTTYTWDYNNRLSHINKNKEDFYYSYDVNGQRIKAETPSDTLYYPTKFYTDTGSGPEKHIFLGDTAVASVKGSNSSAHVYSIHSDHLTGSNVVTDSTQAIDQLTDYYSFGTIRLDDQTGSYNEMRKFTGHEYDADTGLTYMDARYYDANLGRFLSQDPAFLAIGNFKNLENIIQQSSSLYFSNPQDINSYSYVINNPLKYKDVTGEFFGVDDAAGALLGSITGVGLHITSSLIANQPLTWGNVGGAATAGAIIGFGTVNAPETLGASLGISVEIAGAIAYGGFGTLAGNTVKQGVDIATGDQKTRFDFKETAYSTVIGGISGGITEGFIPNAKIPMLSSGRGNMESIGRGLETKLANGSIGKISLKTSIKSAIGSQASDSYKSLAGTIFSLPPIYQDNRGKKYGKK